MCYGLFCLLSLLQLGRVCHPWESCRILLGRSSHISQPAILYSTTASSYMYLKSYESYDPCSFHLACPCLNIIIMHATLNLAAPVCEVRLPFHPPVVSLSHQHPLQYILLSLHPFSGNTVSQWMTGHSHSFLPGMAGLEDHLRGEGNVEENPGNEQDAPPPGVCAPVSDGLPQVMEGGGGGMGGRQRDGEGVRRGWRDGRQRGREGA